jgi:hypothetical protein
MGRSRGGLTSKIHAVVDSNGLRVGSRLQPEKHTTTGLRLSSCLASNREQCCSPTVAMTRTGSEPSPPRGALGPTSRRDAIATSLSVLARLSTEPATWSSGSSTRSGTVGVWPPAMTSLRSITSPSSNSHQFGYGCALMSPRPNAPQSGEHVSGNAPAHAVMPCALMGTSVIVTLSAQGPACELEILDGLLC